MRPQSGAAMVMPWFRRSMPCARYEVWARSELQADDKPQRPQRLRKGQASAGKALLPQAAAVDPQERSEEHTSELQSLMRISYAVFFLKKKIHKHHKRKSLTYNTTNSPST